MNLRGLVVTATAALGVVAWLWAGGGNSAATVESAHGAGGGAAGVRYRGLAIQLSSGHKAVERYGPLLHQIAELGADTVLFSVAGHMEHAKAQQIFVDIRRSPAPDDLRELIRAARQQRLKVIVMPIVLLTNPRGSEWRGVIDPPDWSDWWEQYRNFVLYFADIAKEGGADALMVGSELVSTEKYTGEWVKIIAAARERFPGQLGYSANWDHYKPIQFWDKLDFVGMTSYYTLADRHNPSVDDIVKRWRPIYDEIAGWQRKVGKPIVMTEVGWCSQEGAAMAPWNYYQNQKATAAGMEEQRRFYEAYLKVWDNSPLLAGVIWWEWTPGDGGPGDFGYSPKGKPAEGLLRQWFTAGRAAAEAPTKPPAAER